MNPPLTYYFLIGALILTVVCAAILLGELLAWRHRCKSKVLHFTRREMELQGEIDDLRSRFDEINRENHDVEEELSALRREIADREVVSETPPEKKIDVLAMMMHPEEAPQGSSSLYPRFISVIEGQLGNSSLQIDEIGQQLNMSRVQLYRRLKAETGMTPNELLRTYRLAVAAKMLTTTNLTIAEIAYRVGFSSPSYFSRCFREQFDTLPQDLRQASRQSGY